MVAVEKWADALVMEGMGTMGNEERLLNCDGEEACKGRVRRRYNSRLRGKWPWGPTQLDRHLHMQQSAKPDLSKAVFDGGTLVCWVEGSARALSWRRALVLKTHMNAKRGKGDDNGGGDGNALESIGGGLPFSANLDADVDACRCPLCHPGSRR